MFIAGAHVLNYAATPQSTIYIPELPSKNLRTKYV